MQEKYPTTATDDKGVVWIKDVIGGVHSEGLGWNPQGVYCGECGKVSCEGCFYADFEKVLPTK